VSAIEKFNLIGLQMSASGQAIQKVMGQVWPKAVILKNQKVFLCNMLTSNFSLQLI
jgi:hypothetical protein